MPEPTSRTPMTDSEQALSTANRTGDVAAWRRGDVAAWPVARNKEKL